MAASLKSQLANRPDAREKDITLKSVGGDPITATIRRLTIHERDALIKEFKIGDSNGDEHNMGASIAIVTRALVTPAGEEALTEEEVRAMPAAIVDEVAAAVMDFNGWTRAGKAALDDQFRPAAGPAV